MKQVFQSLSNGVTELIDVPCPKIKPGHLLIRTHATLVSAGTERMLVEFGKANLLMKARQQPERVLQVIEKIKTDGLLPTIDAVRAKLDQPLPLGYSNAGVVMDVGKGVEGFSVGDRVVSNGHHAEIVCIPKNLCVHIPNSVRDGDAAFTVVASIGLQGIRLASPTLGESFVVIGLGLIGLISAQLLRAHGCRVLGIDLSQDKLNVARQLGIDVVDLTTCNEPAAAGVNFSRGRGVDGVIITADTLSNEPVHQAAQMCRKRGRIILVGVTGLQLSRADFYEKELSFQVSCSYGPGRYDPLYEEKGIDYPLGYVRWTEQRNFEAVLDMMASGQLELEPLISHRFSLEQSLDAYRLLSSSEKYLGIVLDYSDTKGQASRDNSIFLQNPDTNKNSRKPGRDIPVVGVIGAGNFTTRFILPALKKTGVRLKNIASSGGSSSLYAGRKYGFEEATSDAGRIFSDEEISTIFITTRHDTHSRFVMGGLNAGKSVFVEKPLCLSIKELDEIVKTVENNGKSLIMVGYNRRFAPQIQKMKSLLDGYNRPKSFIVTVNAGEIPPDHWTQDPEVGGGRIVGEACHFIDLLRFLAGQPIISVQAVRMGSSGSEVIVEDKISITLSFMDGSFGTIHYFANGHKSFPKEKIEVFSGGRILSLDNFRVLRGYGWPGFTKMKLWRQDKGHSAGVEAFINAVKNNYSAPIPFSEIEEVMRVTIKVTEMVRQQ